jgi:ABC-type multidrug transport system fused ATPase/permease subunit
VKVLWRVTKEASRYKGYLIAAAISTLILTGLNLVGPRIQTLIIGDLEKGLNDETIRHIFTLALTLLAVYFCRVIFRFLSNILAHKAAWNIVQIMRMRLYSKMQSFSTEYFTKAETGDLMSRVINDTATFEQLYAHIIPDGVSNVLTLAGVTVILFLMNTRLALLTLIPIPLIVFLSVIFARKIRPIFRKNQKTIAGLNTQLHDNFAGIQEIRAFGQEEREEKKVFEKVREYTVNILYSLYAGAFYFPTIEFLTSLGTVIVMGIGGYLAYKNQISVTYIFGFLLYLTLFYAPITALTQLLEQAQQALAGAERVIEILDTPVEIKTEEGAVAIDNCEGAVSFENVCFGYTKDVTVLKDISFDVRPGQFVALVGPTGVGKTTVVKLAARLYDPGAGTIRLDGHDLRKVTLESLHKNIAFVPQDTYLFNMKISENIAFAHPDASMDEIVAAAKIARIHDDIMAMPEGYDSVAGERGVKLSGGQKQRIAIARAVICGAPVLILDEATSSVDAETERMIQRSIDELTGKHTVIAIAHRLSTIRNADLILVFDEGDIVQRGTHEELMREQGLYSRMYSLQSTEE